MDPYALIRDKNVLQTEEKEIKLFDKAESIFKQQTHIIMILQYIFDCKWSLCCFNLHYPQKIILHTLDFSQQVCGDVEERM